MDAANFRFLQCFTSGFYNSYMGVYVVYDIWVWVSERWRMCKGGRKYQDIPDNCIQGKGLLNARSVQTVLFQKIEEMISFL